ncbi:exodeoxyribonuclease V subunit alpha [Lampropedia puyangensis]|nr:exodeoxyribonuclease V subunit alpha [Lampropedia puyangensis]
MEQMLDTGMPDRTDALVQQLWQWADAGWLRRVDVAFAQWVQQQDAQCHRALPVAVSVLCALEGRGHSCLELADVHGRLAQWLDWPRDMAAQTALRQLLALLPTQKQPWLTVLQSPLIAITAAGGGVMHKDPTGQESQSDTPMLLAVNARGEPQRLYLRRYFQFEQAAAHGLLARVQPIASQVQTGFAREEQIAEVLGQLFPSAGGGQTPPQWQKMACALALRQRLGVITGGPGTGKTYTAARLMAAALALADDPAQLRIRLAAPTGKAAARLSESLQQALQDLPPAVRSNTALFDALNRIPAARTLHSLLGVRPGTRQLRHDGAHPLALDWLIVDEASMVDLEMMAALLQAMPPHAHLVLLGDKDQLDSVEAGAVLGDVCEGAQQGHYSAETAAYLQRTCAESVPEAMLQPEADAQPAPALSQAIAMLRESRRFGGMIGQLALAVQRNDGAHMQALMTQLQSLQPDARTVFWKEQATEQDARQVFWGQGHNSGMSAEGYGALAALLKAMPRWPSAKVPAAGPDDESWLAWQGAHAQWARQLLDTLARFRILCATRQGTWGVDGMNALVIQALRAAGLPVKNQGWFVGRVVMVTRNDASLGIFNGDVGIALPAANNRQQLRVYFPQTGLDAQGLPVQSIRSIAVSRMQHVETAFAMTVHKSQGSEFAHVLLCLPGYSSPLLTRELLYTGLTRAKKYFSYLSAQTGAWQQAMAQSTLRTSGLVALLYGDGWGS